MGLCLQARDEMLERYGELTVDVSPVAYANNFGAPSTPATLRSYIETVMHSSDDPNGTPYVFQKLEEGNPLVQDFRLGFVHPRLTHATAPELFLGAWHRGIA